MHGTPLPSVDPWTVNVSRGRDCVSLLRASLAPSTGPAAESALGRHVMVTRPLPPHRVLLGRVLPSSEDAKS